MQNVPSIEAVECHALEMPSGEKIFWTGPSFDEGPLPAFFYFSLAGDSSLCLAPFNLPIAFLKDEKIRCYSLTLPGHGDGFDDGKAIAYWARHFSEGENPIANFVDKALAALQFLCERGLVDEGNIAVGGLSRGGFAAVHMAARHEKIKAVLGFAPLTDLLFLHDFADLEEDPYVCQMSLSHHVEMLLGKRLRFYVGNRDVRVGTERCFHFVSRLVECSFENKIRSPQVEMVISPSVGYKGHGTTQHVFYDGVVWLKDQLL